MAHKITDQDKNRLRQRMLSGEPFTYGDLSAEFAPHSSGHHDPDRVVDRMIQSLRRAGQISFKRMGAKVIWAATSRGQVAYRELREVA